MDSTCIFGLMDETLDICKGRCSSYGYVPLNIPPRAPSRTPRLNNIQIYIATQPQTPRDSAYVLTVI